MSDALAYRVMRPVDSKFVKGDPESCWQWKAGRSGQYGIVNVILLDTGKKSAKTAHRVVYEALVGAVADGLVLDHLCRNTLCVNPAHLEPVTSAENLRRGLPYHPFIGMTHCRRGHSLTDDSNVRVRNGSRHCIACQNIRNAKRGGPRV